MKTLLRAVNTLNLKTLPYRLAMAIGTGVILTSWVGLGVLSGPVTAQSRIQPDGYQYNAVEAEHTITALQDDTKYLEKEIDAVKLTQTAAAAAQEQDHAETLHLLYGILVTLIGLLFEMAFRVAGAIRARSSGSGWE